MARVGRFGRTRRLGSSNLTQIIANLMREQRAAEDRAAFDAWENGGMFKGAPMTDKRIMDYIKGRRNGFSQDDPLWDEWNNTLIQTRFSIGEQKIGLAFKQGKVGAGAVASWYRKQLNDIPRNSAFYRDVAGRAAEWAKSAAGAARGAAASAARKAMEQKYNRLKRNINRANDLTAAIEREARKRGIITDGSIWEADATRLEQMFAQGVVVDGEVVTMADWRRSAVVAYNSTNQLRPVYKAFKWDTSNLGSAQQQALTNLNKINAIDDRSKYETARDLWKDRLSDAQNDPEAIAAINAAYASTLQEIYDGATFKDSLGNSRNEKNQENDDLFVGGLLNEINALGGNNTGKTVAELFDIEDNDSETTATSAAINQANLQMLADGKAYYGQTETGGEYKIIANPTGSIDKDPSWQRTAVKVNGQWRDTYLKGAEVRSAILMGPDGETAIPVDQLDKPIQWYLDQGYTLAEDGKVVGYVFRDPSGDPSYGVYRNGVLEYTEDNPFGNYGETSDGGLVVLGSADETGNIDPGSLMKSGTMPFSPVPMVGGADSNSLAKFFESTGDEADAALALLIREKAGTPSALTNGQTSDSQSGRNGYPLQAPIDTPEGKPRESSVVQSTLSSTLTAMQTGLAPLFGVQQSTASTPTFGTVTMPPAPKPPKLKGPNLKSPEPKEPKPPKNEAPPPTPDPGDPGGGEGGGGGGKILIR